MKENRVIIIKISLFVGVILTFRSSKKPTKNINELKAIKKIEKKINIKTKLNPEIKTVANQLTINNIDCPKSGWSINKIITDDKRMKLRMYFI